MSMLVDASAFQPETFAPETVALNADIIAKMSVMPDTWAFPAQLIRDLRKSGRGIFPVPAPSQRATTIEIPAPRGPIQLRVITPARGAPRGVYLHIHGGGWTFGSSDMQDDRLEILADAAGVATVSVEYHLAPEWPYPSAHDDCEHAALWLMRNAKARFGTDALTIGGESAGAHLTAATLLRMRDRHGLMPFRAANLVAGCYDLALTPSAAAFNERLILTTRDIRNFVRAFVPAGVDLSNPDISPLNADLRGLPACFLSVGTRDALVDDTLFMASRLTAAGVSTEMKLWPGGCHVFQSFDFPMGRAAEAASAAFIAKHL